MPWTSTRSAAAQADDVEVDLGGRVFAVVEVEHRLAGDDAGADGRDAVAEDRACATGAEPARTASATATNAAVIAAVRVPPSALSTSASTWIVQGPSAWRSTTAQAPADQPLDLGGPAVRSPPDSRRRAARQHGVLGRQPADRLPFQERRHRLGNVRRHQDDRPARPVEHAAGTVSNESPLDRDGAELIVGPAVGSVMGGLDPSIARKSRGPTRIPHPAARPRAPSGNGAGWPPGG